MADSLFRPCGGRSEKFACTVCGRTGYNTYGGGWQAQCLRGHALCARGCGRMLSVRKDGSPRTHPHCPQ